MKAWLLTIALATAATLSLAAQTPASPPTFINPILPRGADPSVVFAAGAYFSVQSCGRDGNPGICLRSAKTLPALKESRPVVVWRAPSNGPNSTEVWAPQVDVLDGALYIYYAADARGDNDHRLFALVPRERGKPLGAWMEAPTGAPAGQLVTDWKSAWAIDPDVFRASNGGLYLLYSCRQDNSGSEFGRSQSICIAAMSDPLHLKANARNGREVVELSQPRQAWERRGWPTEEGPFGFTRDGVDYVLYSGSFSGNPDQYAEGMLRNDHPPQPAGFSDALMNPAAWVKVGPIFDGHHAAYGTASTVLVPSPDHTEWWQVYHGTDCKQGCARVGGKTWRDRSDRAQEAWWTATGELLLGYPVDVLNTDGSGRNVTLAAPSTTGFKAVVRPLWGDAFGDASEGDLTHGRQTGTWTVEGSSIANSGSGPAQSFFASNPNLQKYTVFTKLKRVEGAGRFGVYAAYVDHANFVDVLLGSEGIFVDAVVDGKKQAEKRCAMPDGFAAGGENELAVEVFDTTFRVLVNGRPVAGACQDRRYLLLAGQMPDHGTNGQTGVFVESGRASFTAFHVTAGVPVDSRHPIQLFALRSMASRMNLDNGCAGGCGGKPKTDAAVIAVPPDAPYPATISTTQLWTVRGNKDGSFALLSGLSGMCLEARGPAVLQEPCQRNDGQAWWFVPSTAGGFLLQNKESAQVIEQDGPAIGGSVRLAAIADAKTQSWMLLDQ